MIWKKTSPEPELTAASGMPQRKQTLFVGQYGVVVAEVRWATGRLLATVDCNVSKVKGWTCADLHKAAAVARTPVVDFIFVRVCACVCGWEKQEPTKHARPMSMNKTSRLLEGDGKGSYMNIQLFGRGEGAATTMRLGNQGGASPSKTSSSKGKPQGPARLRNVCEAGN